MKVQSSRVNHKNSNLNNLKNLKFPNPKNQDPKIILLKDKAVVKTSSLRVVIIKPKNHKEAHTRQPRRLKSLRIKR